MFPELLKLHPEDNIAVALVDIPASQNLSIEGLSASVKTVSAIPAMHKVSLTDIAPGTAIVKYGQCIGYASQRICAGDHVHSHNCAMGDIAKDYDFCRHRRIVDVIPEQQRRTFQGFKRKNDQVGTRNFVGILTTVNCSGTVAQQIARHFERLGLANWPNVDGVVPLVHSGGCGMQAGDDGFATLQRTFEGYLTHGNFSGVLVVGLGCETMQVASVVAQAGLAGSIEAFNIQEVGGTTSAIRRGVEHVMELLERANHCERSTCPVSELTLAVQCGGSDGFSGITANPALGVAADLLIQQGGTVIYSETPEIYGAEHLLTQRALTDGVAEQVLERIQWWENYTRNNGFAMDNNPSPGNKKGGLTTIIEKSLGAQAKSGTTSLNEVCLYAQRPTQRGLVFMDSPGFDPVSVTGQVAAGANMVCFTTGRGSAFGCKPVPSIKLATNSQIYHRMAEDMDINCGELLDGQLTLQALGVAIFEEIIAVASGKKTKSEMLGYGDVEFNPWKIGAVL